MTFESFDVRGNKASRQQRESLEGALRSAENYAQDPEGWLVFLGPTGCGKTHLVHAIANERLKFGREVLYFQVADLLDYLRVTYSPESTVTYDRLFDEVRNAPLLALEDLGTHYPTPWAREKLHQILGPSPRRPPSDSHHNHRVGRRKKGRPHYIAPARRNPGLDNTHRRAGLPVPGQRLAPLLSDSYDSG